MIRIIILMLMLSVHVLAAKSPVDKKAIKYGDKIDKKLFRISDLDISALEKYLDSNKSNETAAYFHTYECIEYKKKRVKGHKWKKYEKVKVKQRVIAKIELTNELADINLKLDGFIMTGNKFEFGIDGGCNNLYPITFVSGADQMFRGVKLLKGDIVSKLPYYEKGVGGSIHGLVGKDGYIIKKKSRDSFGSLYDNVCLGIKRKGSYKKGIFQTNNKYTHFIYDKKLYSHEDVYVGSYSFNGWPSKYFQNVRCTKNPQAKVACSSLVYDFEELERDWKNGEMEGQKLTNKKCDKLVFEYEVKSGKKVSISPDIPKNRVNLIKKAKYFRSLKNN